MTAVYGRRRKVVRFLGLFAIAVFSAASCMNPFSSGDSRDSNTAGGTGGADGSTSSPGTGSLVISFGGSGFTAQTILPEDTLEDAIDTYTIRLDEGPLEGVDFIETGLAPADFPFTFDEVPTGEWTLTVEGWGLDGSDPPEPVLVGEYIGAVTILDGQTSQVDATVRGTQYGTGRLEYTLTWPAGEADGVMVQLDTGSYGVARQTLVENDDYVLSGDPVNELNVTLEEWQSGTYFLVITFTLSGGQNAPVIEAAQVYDNRTSRKTVNLPPGALTQPPAAPSGLAIDQPDFSTVRLHWTDASSTEEGFRIYRNGSAEPIATVGPGIETWDDTAFTGGESYTYEVRSFNDFGESPAGAAEVGPVVPISDVGLEAPVNNGIDLPLQAMFEWDPGFGADTLEFYVLQNGTVMYSSTGIENTQGGYTLTEANQLLRDTTYTWYVVADNASFRVQTPELTFTTRGPDLYVNADGGVDNLRRGTTAAEPLASVGYAVSELALPGDRIHVATGVYTEPTIDIGTDIIIEGNSGPTIRPSGNQSNVISMSGTIAVELHGINVEIPVGNETKQGIFVNGISSFLLENSSITHSGTSTTQNDYALNISNADNVLVQGNRITMNDNSPTTSNHQAVRVSSSPQARFNANRIRLTGTEGVGSRKAVWVFSSEGIEITNNVFYREDTSISADVSLRSSDQVLIAHNTFVRESGQTGTNRGIIILGSDGTASASQAVEVVNNLFVVRNGSHPRALYVNSTNTSTFEMIEANAFYGFDNFASYEGNNYALMAELNEQTFAAGNIDVAELTFESEVFAEENWFRPVTPAATGNPQLVRSLLLAGGTDGYTTAVPDDINGGTRQGAISIGAHQRDVEVTVIGATGPAGGWIFYENLGYVSDGWRFLESAPDDANDAGDYPYWGSVDVPETGPAIGQGLSNTLAILQALDIANLTGMAAQLVFTYQANGYSDWFLPSIDELVQMGEITDFAAFDNAAYFSSTQSSSTAVSVRNPAATFNATATKSTNQHPVRGVRRF